MSDPRVASACRTVAAFGTYRWDTMSESGMGPQDPGMTGPDEDPLRKLPPVPPEDAHLHVMVDYSKFRVIRTPSGGSRLDVLIASSPNQWG